MEEYGDVDWELELAKQAKVLKEREVAQKPVPVLTEEQKKEAEIAA